MPEMTEADQIRILIATDNHVGYAERDPIRKDDSWKSFEEIMKLAKSKEVDMVLLAGDLFHDNKPSRKAMYQVMRALRQNCLGPKPCELQMLSDWYDVSGVGSFNNVNYEDLDINVAIPVFSIHGNHDDPSGDGHYCALDLLEVAGLVNYFGRIPESDNISVKPLLFQKGQTKLALYGMGNVRDERLFRTFRDGKVKWLEPNIQKDDWFNLMAVHQNHHAHTDTSYLPEHFLPDFLDLVIWGHEHECLINPRQNIDTGFHVIQPGSSVATSLIAAEAQPKHVAILTVTGKEFNVEPHRIKTVRPFMLKEITLATEPRFKGLERMKTNKHEVSAKLREVVDEMIAEAIESWREIQDTEPEDIPKPIIRLKVDYSSSVGQFECENPQRFSNDFNGKVANTNDVVVFHRKKKLTKKEAGDMPEESRLASLAIDDLKVHGLVREFLEAQSLKILPQAPFTDAVDQFVGKDDKDVLEAFVHDSLADQVKSMLQLEPDAQEDDLEDAMEARRAELEAKFQSGALKGQKRKVKYHPRPDDWDSDFDGKWEENPAAMYTVAANDDGDDAPAPSRRRGARAASEDDDDDMESIMAPPPAKKAAAKRAPAKKAPAKKAPAKKAPAKKAPAKAPARGRKKATPFISDEEEEEEVDDDDDDVIMLDDEPQPKKTQPKRAAASRGKATATKQTQLSFSQASRQTQKNSMSNDEISDDEDAFQTTQQSSRKR